jgi:hypothetical protein
MCTFPLARSFCRESVRRLLSMGRPMVRDDPRTLPAALRALAVPAITLGNCLMERVLARRCTMEYRRLRGSKGRNCAAIRVAEVAA